MEEERIDKIIMERKLVSSRVRAEELISKFGVLVNGKLISKPGKKVPVDAEIQLISDLKMIEKLLIEKHLDHE